MTSQQRQRSGTAQPRPQSGTEPDDAGTGGDGPDPAPPEAEVRPDHQPVEIRHADGGWAVGRINGWWRGPDGNTWCRLRVAGSGAPARWVVFDAARLTLLQAEGT
ncbi:hypothetical protein GCM10009760_57150 [Kitasatospora kazusensis]|uniref:Uncharacterized protein n=1 Tax=Kitasatospora kazusensis TaxID=407974 RepID=A0ABN3A9N1_9ACTN